MENIDFNKVNNNNLSLSHYAGNLIRQARIKNNLTGSQLAQRVHISQQQISRYECGKTNFQLDILLKLLLALNMNELEIKDFFYQIVHKTNSLSIYINLSEKFK